MLAGDELPSYAGLAAYLLDTSSGYLHPEPHPWSLRTTTASFTPTAQRTTTCFTNPILTGCVATREY